MAKKKIGLFFGSFNPVHVGHLIIASHIVDSTDLKEVWLVVSPHNPLKNKASLANDYDRLHMVELAIGDSVSLRASNIEFGLPRPSYTIDTLTYMSEKYPNYDFALIMGGDNIQTLDKWKNYLALVKQYPIYVYARPGYNAAIPADVQEIAEIHMVEAPLLELSSTFIREKIQMGDAIKYLVGEKVADYIESARLYK